MGRWLTALLVGVALLVGAGAPATGAAPASTPTDQQRLAAAFARWTPILATDYARLMSTTRALLAAEPEDDLSEREVRVELDRLERHTGLLSHAIAGLEPGTARGTQARDAMRTAIQSLRLGRDDWRSFAETYVDYALRAGSSAAQRAHVLDLYERGAAHFRAAWSQLKRVDALLASPIVVAPKPLPEPPALPNPFAITSVTWPKTVVSGGARGHLTIRWSGAPFFPVKAVYQPRPGTCPAGVSCTTPTTTFTKPVNPFVFRDALWCAGLTKAVLFDYEVVLIDRAGTRTAPYRAGFTCAPA